MLGDEAVHRLKRSMSDVDDLIPVGQATPPGSPSKRTPKNRSNRAFSWTKLTESITGKGRQSRSSRASSIDKREISSPILDTRNPLCPHTPKFTLERPSPTLPPSILAEAQSSLWTHAAEPTPFRATARHLYSASDPTNKSSPPERRPQQPDCPPPPIPRTFSFSSSSSTLGSPLERIAESPFESDRVIEPLELDNVDKKLQIMEPTRLQPPVTGGTKMRAIQQAKEMEALVAERAKRGGDEAPPYDFIELIGKGAYGRVFKGCV